MKPIRQANIHPKFGSREFDSVAKPGMRDPQTPLRSSISEENIAVSMISSQESLDLFASRGDAEP